ncbi:GDP-mannose 4,6-dehydratase [Rhodopseudomonas sp. RCAM05734]|uniref:GDP-mannose 4,6-dehydratase n=1 Tax=Rhodopseudomonas sp. RCAM05734 TaxID=3457549 RepID=UPI0040450CEA
MNKSALVTGAAGQDGSYLIDLLLSRGYAVHAQSRQPRAGGADRPGLQWHIGALTDPQFLDGLLGELRADEIYNLAAVSRPALSWEIPFETTQLNAIVPQRICEFLVKTKSTSRLFQASSSEIFGDTDDALQNETTCCRPKSPYGISKCFAHQMTGAYRERNGLHASCGILFNHESPLRPLSFVSQKIAHAAAAVSLGMTETRELDERGRPIVSKGKVLLGNLDIRRDFGFAGDVARAMHMMLQSEQPADYVIGTGENHSIAEFCEAAFGFVGLDWRAHVDVDPGLVRASDMRVTTADTSRLVSQLGWKPEVGFSGVVAMMVTARISALQDG